MAARKKRTGKRRAAKRGAGGRRPSKKRAAKKRAGKKRKKRAGKKRRAAKRPKGYMIQFLAPGQKGWGHHREIYRTEQNAKDHAGRLRAVPGMKARVVPIFEAR
jgi:hypothetical protein